MEIKVNDKIYQVEYIYKPTNKSMYIRFDGNKFSLSGYRKFNEKTLNKFLIDNIDNFKKIIIRSEKRSVDNIDGGLHFFGKPLDIKYIDMDSTIKREGNTLYISNNYKDCEEKNIKKYYTLCAKEYITNRFLDIILMYPDIKIKPKLIFKYTETFYGRCYPRKGIIEFSGVCMKYDPIYIDCIIHHEICHLKYLGHQSDFYNYFEAHFKNAKKIQHELRMHKYKDKY